MLFFLTAFASFAFKSDIHLKKKNRKLRESAVEKNKSISRRMHFYSLFRSVLIAERKRCRKRGSVKTNYVKRYLRCHCVSRGLRETGCEKNRKIKLSTKKRRVARLNADERVFRRRTADELF